MKANDKDVGPFRVDLLLDVWPKLVRTADALHALGVIPLDARGLHLQIAALAEQQQLSVETPAITLLLRLVALQEDGMHAGDWLRMRAAEARLPRRKAPPAVDLQIRLKGVNCVRFVAKVDPSAPSPEDGGDPYRVTIKTTRGDVVSCQGPSFTYALEGAVKLAGRSEATP